MSFSALSTKLILLTAGGALAGAGTGAAVRQAMAPGPAAFVESVSAARRSIALADSSTAGPASPTQPGRTLTLLTGFQNAGTPSQQIDFALQFAALDSVEEIHDLLRKSSQFPPHSASAIAKVILMKRWMELEPAGALAYCRLRANAYLPKLIADYSREKPAEARALVLSLPSGKDRTLAWQELCALALDGPPDEIWSMLAAPPIRDLPHPHSALGGLTRRLVKRNPQDALARLGSLPTMVLVSTRLALAEELTRLDPAAGWAWALQQPRPAELMTTSLKTVLAADPGTAISLLASLPPERQWETYGRYRVSWDIKDAAALAAAISGTDGISGEHKAGMARKFLIASAVDDPSGVDALVPLLAPGVLETTLKSYLGAWAKSFPPGAAKWISSLPPGPFRTAAEFEWNNRKSSAP